MLSLKSSKLLNLPRELRDKIWEYAIAEEAEEFVLEPGMALTQFFYPNTLPPIAFIRRSHFEEVFLVWVRTHSFELRFSKMMPPSFVWWMDKIGGGRAWVNVKSMSFTAALRIYQPGLGAGLGVSNAADLVARATTIKHIRPISELLATLDFRNILHCERLQSLTLLCCPTWKKDRCIEADDLGCIPETLFVSLCNWFWYAFRARGRKVAVHGKLERRGKRFSAEPEWKWGV